MPRVLAIVLLTVASAGVILARLGLDVAATPSATSAPRDPAHPPAAVATAGDLSAARRRFIARVDQTCVRTVRRGRAAQAAYARSVTGRTDAEELVTRSYVRWHTGQYRALRALGDPPEARLAYRRWLDNLAARVRLEARYTPLLRAGRAAEAQTAAEQVNALRARGDMLGRRFGLKRCTSGAPVARSVPG